MSAIPSALFEAPLLRGLGEPEREAIRRAARSTKLRAGELLYDGDRPADSVFVVIEGAVRISGERRGHAEASVLRVARASESFGEEALLFGGSRRLTAEADGDAEVVEVPAPVLERALGRVGGSEVAHRERRFAERAAMRDLVRTVAFAHELSPTDLEILLDGARPRRVARGERVFTAGDPAEAFFLILDGLVQLSREVEGRPEVRAYLSRGDFFGDEDLIAREPRALSAAAPGGATLIEVPASVFATLADRNPKLLARVRRVRTDREHAQAHALGARTTQHVFRDAFRMQMARSLLVIDPDTCVRCGHCAWTCESLYDVSRLVRRGDKVVTDGGHKSLLLPSSCQHCKNPLCMVDCPTGAIGRDPEGEVFIREELCIGCGNCAKACPWENIRMAPRPDGARVAEGLRHGQTDVAVKCDLCRGYEAPACVSACPTQSIVRLEPTQDIAEVAEVLGPGFAEPTRPATPRKGWPHPLAIGAALGVSITAALAHARGAVDPSRGVGWGAGWVALLTVIALVGYSVPKRLPRLWLRRRERDARAPNAAVSRVRPLYRMHLAVGGLGVAAVLLHAGPALSASGALGLTFFLVSGLGALGAALYRVIPRRLTRLERHGALPEDLRGERERLFDRMHREASGTSELVKALLDRVLVPYARSSVGPLALLCSGRSLKEERAHLSAHVDAVLEGRGAGKLEGLDELVRVVVELRALPARRALGIALRAWLIAHLVLTGVLGGLIVLHLARVLS